MYTSLTLKMLFFGYFLHTLGRIWFLLAPSCLSTKDMYCDYPHDILRTKSNPPQGHVRYNSETNKISCLFKGEVPNLKCLVGLEKGRLCVALTSHDVTNTLPTMLPTTSQLRHLISRDLKLSNKVSQNSLFPTNYIHLKL